MSVGFRVASRVRSDHRFAFKQLARLLKLRTLTFPRTNLIPVPDYGIELFGSGDEEESRSPCECWHLERHPGLSIDPRRLLSYSRDFRALRGSICITSHRQIPFKRFMKCARRQRYCNDLHFGHVLPPNSLLYKKRGLGTENWASPGVFLWAH